MHERIMNGLKKIDSVMARALGIKEYPTLEDLQTNFPHKQGCSGDLPLRNGKGILLSADIDPRVGLGYSERISRLSCDECHETREYLEHK